MGVAVRKIAKITGQKSCINWMPEVSEGALTYNILA